MKKKNINEYNDFEDKCYDYDIEKLKRKFGSLDYIDFESISINSKNGYNEDDNYPEMGQ